MDGHEHIGSLFPLIEAAATAARLLLALLVVWAVARAGERRSRW